MGQPEQFSLRWSEYEETVGAGLRELRAGGELQDVTLVVEDGQLAAHRVVLASCSSFFRRVLVACPHHSPLLYLRGVPRQELAAMLDFMYRGEVSIGQDRLAAFLAVAEDLQVKGLTNAPAARQSPTKVNRRKQCQFTGSPGGKRPRVESPLAAEPDPSPGPSPAPAPGTAPAPAPASGPAPPHGPAAQDSIVAEEEEDPIAEVQVKAEPASNHKESDMSKQLAVQAGEPESDFGDGFATAASYSDYQDDASAYDNYDSGQFGLSFGPTFPFVASEQEHVRERRQLILQFITANKGRLSDTYVCLICNKQVTDNSNMNKHLEFKHGAELKAFLQSLAV